MERLNKYIASTGYSSRREADKLIFEGHVSLDNKIVKDPSIEVDSNNVIKIDGEIIRKPDNLVYYMLNKPTGYIVTNKDDKSRKTIYSLINEESNLRSVGRLDYDTSGLLILTNDGDFINLITSPQNKIEKEYKVKIQGLLRREESRLITKGIDLGEYKTKPCKIFDVEYNDEKTSTILNIVISEGKNREIRRMFDSINHPVKSLKRTRIGNLKLDIDTGYYRRLKPHEIKLLKLLALGKIEK